MKQIVYLIIILLLVASVIGLYVYNNNQIQDLKATLNQKNLEIENLNDRISNLQTTEEIQKEPIIVEKLTDAGSMLSAECINTSYLESRAIYVFDSLVEEININNSTNKKTINLKIMNWLKGDKDTDTFQIITGVAEHGDSAKIEEGKYYRTFLQQVPNSDKLIFVCDFAGVKELGLI